MFALPPLPYPVTAFEPVISAATMRLHHDKHHARYVDVTNELLPKSSLVPGSLEEVIAAARTAGDRKLANNAGQAWNHAFFWECMRPTELPAGPKGPLLAALTDAFGGAAELRRHFIAEGAGHFGSGWVWLVARGGRVALLSTHDGDSALSLHDTVPLLVCDVWEHAYYLDHRNDRGAFLTAWWSLVNWDFVERQYAAAVAGRGRWEYPAPVKSVA